MDLTIIIDCKERVEVERLLSNVPSFVEVVLCGIAPLEGYKSYPGLSWEQAWRYASGDHLFFIHSSEFVDDLLIHRILKLDRSKSYHVHVNNGIEARIIRRNALLSFEMGLPIVRTHDSTICLDEQTMHRGLRSAIAVGDLDVAHSLVNGLMADLDGDVSGMMRMANMLVAKESYLEARKVLERMVGHNDHFPGLHSRLGLVCNELSDYSAAKRYLLKALSVDPHDSMILNELGRACQGLGEMMRAIDYYNQGKLAEKF